MADGPFLCYRELLSSTSIVRSTFFFCYNAVTEQNDEYLCTLLVSGISVYKVSRPSNDADGEAFLSLKLNEKLFGKPSDVSVYSYGGNTDDLLIISLDAGKLVMVKYVWDRNVLDTVFMCNSEENAFGSGSEVQVQSNGVRRYLGVGNECSVCLCQDNGVVASTIYGQYLVITPVPEVHSDPLKTSLSANESQAQSFAVDIAATLGLTGPIVHAVFVSGYSRPVLVILQQTGLLPIGHAAKVRHCCSITALAVNLEPKTLSVLWQRTHLPHDCVRLVPLHHAAFAGAVAVVSLNAVIVVNQEEAQGVATNGFAATTVDTVEAHYRKGGGVGVKVGGIGLQSWVSQEEGIELDGSYWAEDSISMSSGAVGGGGSNVVGTSGSSDSTTLIGCLKDGTILRIGMVLSTQRMLSSVLFTPEVVATTVRASSFCTSQRGDLWFLGSRQSTALLVGVRRLPGVQRCTSSTSSGSGVSSFLSPSSKRYRSSSVVSNDPHTTDNTDTNTNTRTSKLINSVSDNSINELYAEECELYGHTLDTDPTTTTNTNTSTSSSIRTHTMSGVQLRFEIHDSLPVLGPMLHGLCTKQDNLFEHADTLDWQPTNTTNTTNPNTNTTNSNTSNTAASHIPERDSRDTLLLSSGLDQDGAILKVYNGLHMSKLADRSMPGATRIHTLHCSTRTEYAVLLVSYQTKTRVLHCDENANTTNTTELKFTELNPAEAGFICTSPTINVGFIDTPSRVIVQILPHCVRVAKLGAVYGSECDALQDVNVSESAEFGGLGGDVGETIIIGDVCEGYVVLLTSTQKVYTLKYDSSEESVELVDTGVSGIDSTGDSSGMDVVDETSTSAGSSIVSASLYYGVFNVLTTTNTTASHAATTTSTNTNTTNTTNITTPSTPTHTTTPATVTPDSTVEEARNAKLQQIVEEIYLYGHPLPTDDDPTDYNNGDCSSSEVGGVSSDVSRVVDSGVGASNGNGKSKKGSKGKKSRTNSNDTTNNTATSITPTLIDNTSTTTTAATTNHLPQAYLLVSYMDGGVVVVRLQTKECVVRTSAFAHLAESVDVTNTISSTTTNKHTNNTTTDANTTNPTTATTNTTDEAPNLIIETRLTRVFSDPDTHDSARSTLIFAFLLSSGDLVVYSGCEVSIGSNGSVGNSTSNSGVIAFHKIDQCPVINKRTESNKVARSVSADGAASATTSTTTTHTAFVNSTEYTGRGGPTLTTLHSTTYNGILVSGNDCLLITTVHSLPTILPLALPEVPYINYGHYSLVPLLLHSTQGVATLWYECEDLDNLKNPLAGSGTRACHLSLYASVPNLELFPHSCISIKRVGVGRTVHRVSEVLCITDDRTQQALLEKKTLLLACSEEQKVPFLPSVLTEEELLEDSELYERYFTSFESFCQPDYTVGQAPLLTKRLHTLALLQNTSVVDTFTLPANECVLDTTVLYFNVEKYVTLPGALMALRTTEKRVFIAACTAIVEKRGEDTQGNGRLLLFALDYKLYENDEGEEESGTNGSTGVANGSSDSTTNGHTTNPTASTTTNPITNTTSTTNTNTTTAAQAKFLSSIKPKLRQIWAGPGPASVVRQLGEYVLSTVASTVFVYRFRSDTMELEQVSFFFAQLYISTVSILKNFILLGDMHHSVQLLVWREHDHSLNLVSKDFEGAVALSSEFIYDNAKLGMVMGDDEGNVQVFQEAPRKIESLQGTRLLPLADFHLGSDASVLLRHDLLSTDPVKKAMPTPLDNRPPPPPPRTRKGSNFPLQKYATRFNKATVPAKSTLIVGSMDGGIGVLQPVEERMYKRLALMQQIMTMTVPTQLSLNPREYRLYKSARVHLVRKKGVLDGCMLEMFNALPPALQDQLAATVGATSYLIKENLHELDYLCRYF